MAVKLFISPQEIQESTIIGGNVDIDNFNFVVEGVQISIIEPLLGTELYDKIDTEWAANTLAGDYLTLFTEFVQPITKYEATAQYLNIAQYKAENGGVFKNTPDNKEVVGKDEMQSLTQVYHAQAQIFIKRFEKWICLNSLTEYKTSQDEVNAQKDVKVTGGWFFSNSYKYNWQSED